MKPQLGVTLLELLIALAIMAVVGTLSAGAYQNHKENSNFRQMKEVGAKFALAQQQHRQKHGRYASLVQATGNDTSSLLVFPERANYSIQITNGDFRRFRARISTTRANLKPSSTCHTLIVDSTQGFLNFTSDNENDNDTTRTCLPNG